MYAWCLAVARANVTLTTLAPPKSTLIAQPPHDHSIGAATLFHYTWGSIYQDSDKNEVWKFDKRVYVDKRDELKVPMLPMPPEWKEGWKLQDGVVVTRELHDTIASMLRRMNAGIATLPEIAPKSD